MFEPLIDTKVTPKRRKVENLAYKSLKLFPKLAFTLLRLFALNEFEKDFSHWLKQSNSYKSKHRIKGRIDGTFTGKKYAKEMPFIKKLYDYVNSCYIKTHTLYIFVVSIDNKDYIVDFELVKKKKKGSNKIAKQMINRFVSALNEKNSFLHYCRLSLDGAWGNGDMLLYLYKKGFKYVSVKSGGKDLVHYNNEKISLKELERRLSTETTGFKKFNPKRRLKGDYISITVDLVNTNLSIRIVLRRFYSQSNGYRYLMLLSPCLSIYDYQIAQCYEGRWGVEECIKETKQVTKIEDYSFHSETADNIEMFISLRFCLYMVLNWYRVEYCRPSKTSLYKVAEYFKHYFNDIGGNSMWKLFSG